MRRTNSPHPGPLYETTFDQSLRTVLVDALARAYDTAIDTHEPARGSNEATFGFNLYHFATHELSVEATKNAGRMEVATRYPSFRLSVGEYELACHRVGRSERDSIWSSFPNAESAAHTMLEEPLWLPGMAKHMGVEKARRLVLAHMGSPEDGFRAAYVCIPGRTEGTRITEWAFAEPIWSIGGKTAQFANEPKEKVAEEVVAEAVVRRKVRGTEKHGEEA